MSIASATQGHCYSFEEIKLAFEVFIESNILKSPDNKRVLDDTEDTLDCENTDPAEFQHYLSNAP